MADKARTYVREPPRKVGAPAGEAAAAPVVVAAAPMTPHQTKIAQRLTKMLPNLQPAHVRAASECVEGMLAQHLGCTPEGTLPTVKVYMNHVVTSEIFAEKVNVGTGAGVAEANDGTFFNIDNEGFLVVSKAKLFRALQLDHGLKDHEREITFVKRIGLTFENVTDPLIAVPAEQGNVRTFLVEDAVEGMVKRAISLSDPMAGATARVDISYATADSVDIIPHLQHSSQYPGLYGTKMLAHDLFEFSDETPPRIDIAHPLSGPVLELAATAMPACVHAKAAKATRDGHQAIPAKYKPEKHHYYAGELTAAMAIVTKRGETSIRKGAQPHLKIPGVFLGNDGWLRLLNVKGSKGAVDISLIVTAAIISHGESLPPAESSDSDSDA